MNTNEEQAFINKQEHGKICSELNDLYYRKNLDYGDSFHKTYEEEGLAMVRIRLMDKLERFKTLSRGNISHVGESLEDTLLDLANYAIMTVMEIRGETSLSEDVGERGILPPREETDDAKVEEITTGNLKQNFRKYGGTSGHQKAEVTTPFIDNPKGSYEGTTVTVPRRIRVITDGQNL